MSPEIHAQPTSRQHLWGPLAPWLVFVVATWPLRAWIVDDAAISFAYAHNFATGHGLTSQPGVTPVEGYSNPLWVLVVAALDALRLFQPLWTPKLLALALAAATFQLYWRTLVQTLGAQPRHTTVALCLLAAATPYTVWATSGLENPLLAFLLVALLAALSQPVPRWGLAGFLCALLAMTRPDALLLAAVPPLFALLALRFTRPILAALTRHTLGFGLPMAVFLAHRRATFGHWLPNTHLAKGGPGLPQLLDLLLLRPPQTARLVELLESVAGKLAAWVLLALAVGLVAAWRSRRFTLRHLPLLLLLAASAAQFVLMPADWMPEYRFATGFVVLFFGTVALLWPVMLDALHRPAIQRVAGPLVVALALLLDIKRTRTFAQQPTVPLASIAQSAAQFNAAAAILQVQHPSLLIPDLGGQLLDSKLRVYDLAMLCDETIARTLSKDQAKFYDYVFAQTKPTFIHMHDYWTHLARLDEDPRFRRDYLALREYEDADDKARFGESIQSGDFVRRDAVRDPRDVARLKLALKLP